MSPSLSLREGAGSFSGLLKTQLFRMCLLSFPPSGFSVSLLFWKVTFFPRYSAHTSTRRIGVRRPPAVWLCPPSLPMPPHLPSGYPPGIDMMISCTPLFPLRLRKAPHVGQCRVFGFLPLPDVERRRSKKGFARSFFLSLRLELASFGLNRTGSPCTSITILLPVLGPFCPLRTSQPSVISKRLVTLQPFPNLLEARCQSAPLLLPQPGYCPLLSTSKIPSSRAA